MTDPDPTDPNYRSWRRRQSIASTYKPDPRMDRMRQQLDADPAAFDSMYGARGLVVLAMYEAARDAAEGIDDPLDAA